MPQAPRASNARASSSVDKEHTTKAQEQEFKRARGAISCAECRRLKLKCDKTVPCSSCKRRGCASICPNGSLTTGQGTRFILADTDRLHKKITEMSDRIRQLEDGLAILQSSTTRESHPLLRPDLLSIKSGLELHSASNQGYNEATGQRTDTDEQSIDHFGTLNIQDDGAAKYYGWSAGSESLLLGEKPGQEHVADDEDALLPSNIQELARTFPTTSIQLDAADTMQGLIDYLPEWPRAEALAKLYLEQAPWFFGAIRQRQLLEELLPVFYVEARMNAPPAAESPPSQGGSPGEFGVPVSAFASAAARSANTTGTAHELALLFVVFCFGALTDPQLMPAPYNKEASTYYELTRASLNLEPVLDRPPSVATVQTLSLMGIYQGLVAGENSIESTWALMGLSCKLAQSIGLHRDCARWKLPPSEVQKRRALFWELFITDCWQSLATGRLPSFSLPFVDCELPADPDETLDDDGSKVLSFPAWKALWGKECVSAVVEVTLQSRAPKYSLILELDRRIRDVALPKYAQGDPPRNASLSETMKHFMAINYRELTMLYVHRTFFAQALKDYPTDPLRSQYAPSFLAGYRAACAMIFTLREQFNINPVQIARFWVLWTHAFSSAVMLGSVVTHGGSTKTAQAAFSELRLAYDLFDKAARYGGRAVKFLPLVRKLHDKAYKAYTDGLQLQRRDIFTPRSGPQTDGDGNDELSIFSGRTRTVATKSAPKTQSSRGRSKSHIRASPGHTPDSTMTPTDSDPSRSSLSPTAHSSTDASATSASNSPHILEIYGNAVHPMLVDQMRAFEGELDNQIYNAQQAFYLSNASSAETTPLSAGAAPDPHVSTMYSQEYEQPQGHPWQWPSHAAPPPPPSIPTYTHSTHEEQGHHMPPSHGYPQPLLPAHQVQVSPPEQAYSVPMYGAVQAAPPQAHAPVPVQAPPLAMGPSDAPYQQEHWQAQQGQQQHHRYAGPSDQQYSHAYYQSHQQPTPTNSRPQTMHGATSYVQHHHQQVTPPATSAGHVPLHTGQSGYTLQDSWHTFWQHELPVPPGTAGGGPGGPGAGATHPGAPRYTPRG
ncbi:hypothetical protein BDW22DRAFT_1360218 [Trametopsis cervina]|nr:hypothetical protein BDW22DRAFT_1360218 [Trametopsis cervina]